MEGIGDELVVERVLFDSSIIESYVSDEEMVIGKLWFTSKLILGNVPLNEKAAVGCVGPKMEVYYLNRRGARRRAFTLCSLSVPRRRRGSAPPALRCEGSWDVSIERPRGGVAECSKLYSIRGRYAKTKIQSEALTDKGEAYEPRQSAKIGEKVLLARLQYDAQDQHDLRNHAKKPPNLRRERGRFSPKALFENQNPI
jgi:hypothetical protein